MVSSIMEGYESFREAARRAIIDAGGEPVMVEDFPSLPASPRNACLDAVESADVYLGIVALRGGWRAPSGTLVVHEEFEHARRRGKPALVLVQDGERDADAEELARELSGFVRGGFRRTFSSPEELQEEVATAVAPQVEVLAEPPMSAESLNQALEAVEPFQNDATLAVAIAPTRDEEVIDPIRLGQAEFFELLMDIGHRREVALLTHRLGKIPEIRGARLFVIQRGDDPRPPRRDVRIEVDAKGLLMIAANVTGRSDNGGPFGVTSSLQIFEGDLRDAVVQALVFTGAFYDEIDPYGRYQSFLCNGALAGIRYRRIAAAPSTGQGVPMAIHAPDRVLAYDTPCTIVRQSLVETEEETRRMITLLKRRLEA